MLCLFLYYIYSSPNLFIDDRSSPEPTIYTFQGKYVSAQLPESWTILEIENNKNNSPLLPLEPESESIYGYEGLTSLEIYSDLDAKTKIFEINAILGIGGSNTCINVYKFSDTSLSYVAFRRNQLEKSFSDQELSVVDASELPFKEFYIDTVLARLTQDGIFWEDSTNTNTLDGFNTACGLSASIPTDIKLFSFSSTGNHPQIYNSYKWNVTKDYSYDLHADGLTLILTSLKKTN